MASLNQCNFIGNLGADVSIRYTKSGQAVGNVNMAVTEKYKDQEKTEWIRLVFWGKSAEIVERYAGKGSSLFVSGRLQTRSWDKDGQAHYTTEIVVSSFQFLGGGQNWSGTKNNDQNPNPGGYHPQNGRQGPGHSYGGQYDRDNDDGSNIPF